MVRVSLRGEKNSSLTKSNFLPKQEASRLTFLISIQKKSLITCIFFIQKKGIYLHEGEPSLCVTTFAFSRRSCGSHIKRGCRIIPIMWVTLAFQRVNRNYCSPDIDVELLSRSQIEWKRRKKSRIDSKVLSFECQIQY